MAEQNQPSDRQAAAPARRLSFAERLKPQALSAEDFPDLPPPPPADEEETADVTNGSMDMQEKDELREPVISSQTSEQPAAEVVSLQAVPSLSSPDITTGKEPVESEAPQGILPTEAGITDDFADPDFLDDLEEVTDNSIPPLRGKIPPAASEFPADPFALTPSLPVKSPEAEIFPGPAPREIGPVGDFESDRDIKHSFVTRLINPNLNGISCGDDLFIPARPKKTLEEELAELGFPPRPHLWPRMMAWPPRRDMEILQKNGLTKDVLEEYLRAQEVRQGKMLARSKVIEDWLDQYQPDPGLGYRRAEKKSRVETYRGIQWATLLDEEASKDGVAANVMSWGRIRVRTKDGGQARAFPDFVCVDNITQQAVVLAIFEARARGWNTLRISGSAEFGKQAMQICKQYNIAAEVTMPYGFRLRKTFHVAPSLPGPVQVDSENSQFDLDGGKTNGDSKALPSPASRKVGIPASGVDGMPRSPFPSGTANMGRDIDDASVTSSREQPISKRLAFGAELGGDPAQDENKAEQKIEAETPVIEQ